MGQIQVWTVYFWEISWVLDTNEHKIITLWLEGTLGVYLDQPLALSRVESEFRCGCLVSAAHLSMENFQTQWSHSFSGHPVPVLNCLHRADYFPYISLNLLCFNSLLVFVALPLSTLIRDLALYQKAVTSSSAGWTSPFPSASPHRLSAPVLSHLGNWTLLHSLYRCFLYQGPEKWLQNSWWSPLIAE